MATPSVESPSLAPGIPPQTTSVEETTTMQLDTKTDDLSATSIQEIVLEGTEKPESREKLARLNYLLKASGVYSKIIADNIERERASRAAALKKHAELVKKQETDSKKFESNSKKQDSTHSKQGPSPDPKAAERRSSRRTKAAGSSSQPDPPLKTKSSGRQSRRKKAAIVGEDPADTEAEIEKPSENAGPEDEDPSNNTTIPTETHDPHSGQPALITGATLRSYQLAGMHWLATLYENGLNGILADEMGLGKTLQTIAFLCYLRERGVWGPFLIVCPLSTVANWVNEFERFCPTVPVVLYHGTKAEREELRASRMAPPKDDPKAWLGKALGPSKRTNSKAKASGRAAQTNWTKQNTKDTFPIVVTSYEIVMNDCQFLRQYAWSYIVVDESHRLKNLECKLVQELKSYQSANRLLLTGTPLHNNLKELWSLLNFILPEVFDDYSSFEQWFDLSSVTAASDSAAALSTAQAQHIVTSLHAILKPFLLRRVKSEVETSLPKKKEYLLTAPLTAQQKELYDAVINRDLRTYLVNQKTQAGLANHADIIPPLPETCKRKRTPSPSLEGAAHGQNVKRSRTAEPDTDDRSLKEDTAKSNVPEGRNVRNRTRRAAATRKSVGYAEKSDRQFFKEVEEGECDEIDYTWDETHQLKTKSDEHQTNTHEQQVGQLAQKSVNQMKLLNMVMQLRKVCNHPWLFDWPIDPETGEQLVGDGLVAASGKMLLLDKLLKGLFDRGHKVLVFSQFTSMLDIIQDWATELKGWRVCRIDGVTRQDSRREQMKDFNEGQGPDACHLFLLSTRAGGVGINLVAADTVILFDSDWNPQQDLQAQDRVHRIGQTKPVLVFRLVSGNTIESKILEKAGQKRKLETLVIGNGFDLTKKTEEEDLNSDEEIQNILLGKKSNRRKQKSMKELAEALLKTDGERITLVEQGDQILGDDQLDALLDRSDDAMERKLGWKTEGSSTVTTGVEVYHTKAAE
ncbi:hypothetical protein MJO29_003529 [Puccinia striiformis f. sp. tritici]|uniref:hypothetical protein n=1 Tax=Puccinia striiformis f. sp. tritici TaxID=168172 RepID=UPI0020081297|nr:hypothetical protein Pst134EA_004617 [Puccinia striiformis f. sp. tritici]KAH9470693.1 hypothetical protein Pst134EA_004617 [Puccinia striiformis f. sp. tritici]KAI7965431.1 hypothetical protein MJO29_003529 [Puccinia striiformis f. sp. tritici]